MNSFLKSFIKNKLLTIFGLVIVFFSILFYDPVIAEEKIDSPISIKSYNFDAVVDRDHTYDISETLMIDIHGKSNEYSLYIPKGNYRVKDINVEGAKFSIKNAEYDYIINLTSLQELGLGEHKIKLTYKIYTYVDKSEKADIFYMNVLPSTFSTPIDNIKISVLFPKNFPFENMQFFAGQFGVQNVSNKVNANINNNELIMSGTNIPQNFSIILKSDLPENYWRGELDYSWLKYLICGFSLISILIMLILWLNGGKDPKVAPNSDFSHKDMVPPAEANYLLNGNIGIYDLISMIIYLGSKGFLKITEYKPKKYQLTGLKNPDTEPRYVRSLYNKLFDSIYEGTPVKMKDFLKKFKDLDELLSQSVKSIYASKDMVSITEKSKFYRLMSIILISIVNAIIVAICFVGRYIFIDYVTVITILTLTLISTLLIIMGLDNFYRPNKLVNILVLLIGAIVFILVAVYVSLDIYRTFNNLRVLALYIIITLLSLFMIYIMKARTIENARLTSKVTALKNKIIHFDEEKFKDSDVSKSDYFYELIPYAYAFLLTGKWGTKFKDADIIDAYWFEPYRGTHEMKFNNKNENSIEFSKNIDNFGRTLQNEYISLMDKRINK